MRPFKCPRVFLAGHYHLKPCLKSFILILYQALILPTQDENVNNNKMVLFITQGQVLFEFSSNGCEKY